MKIIFSDRKQFNLSVDVIFSPNTRLNSAGDLRTDYTDMTYTFEDKWHCFNAVKRLGLAGISDFIVDNT